MYQIFLITWLVCSMFVLPMSASATPASLPPCPDTPNCVSSQAGDVEPFRFSGPAGEAWRRLIEAVKSLKRSRLVEQSDRYLHAEITSRVFRFVDDLQCLLLPDQQLIQVRSASRVGYSDLGVNRRRVEALRNIWQQKSDSESPDETD